MPPTMPAAPPVTTPTIPSRNVEPHAPPTPAPEPQAAPDARGFELRRFVVLSAHSGACRFEGEGEDDLANAVVRASAPDRTVVVAEYPPIAAGRAATTREVDTVGELARFTAEYVCYVKPERDAAGNVTRIALTSRQPQP